MRILLETDDLFSKDETFWRKDCGLGIISTRHFGEKHATRVSDPRIGISKYFGQIHHIIGMYRISPYNIKN